MQSRYRMTNYKKEIIVEAPYTKEGKARLEHFRQFNPKDWKGCRIKAILQALPSKIKFYQVYKFSD